MAEGAVRTSSRKWLSGAPPKHDDAPARLFLTRVGVALLSASACIVGLLPAILFLDRGASLTFVLLVVVPLALAVAFRIRPTHLQQPGFFEFVAAWLTAISQGALTSFLALQTYLMVRGANRLVKWVLGFFGYSLTSNWSSAARWAAYGFGGIMMLGISVITVKGVLQALYPSVAGFGTPFRGVARSWLGRAALTIGLAAAIAFTVFAFEWPIWRLGIWPCYLTALVLASATIIAWEASQKATAPRAFSTAEEAAGAMLRALGFTVVEQPRTGSPEFDPYLADLDFAISRDDRSFALLIQEASESRPINVHDVSRVAIAAHALSAAARKQAQESDSIEPVLVVVGVAASDELLGFAAQQDVQVIQVANPADLQPATKDDDVLRDAARRLFHQLVDEREAQRFNVVMTQPNQFSLARDRLGRS